MSRTRVAWSRGVSTLALVAAPSASTLLAACHKTESDAARRSEAGQLAHAVEALRAAPVGGREAHLAAVRGAKCSEPDACQLKAVCVEAYELEAQATRDMSDVSRAITDPGHPTPTAAQEILGRARATLRQSYDRAKECADLEGALRRRLGLP